MKKRLNFIILITSIVFIGCITFKSEAIDYYDLYFKKESENIVKCKPENIKDNKVIVNTYPIIVNEHICKDEEDAIGHVLGSGWNLDKKLKLENSKNNLESDGNIKEISLVYKEIKGVLVKDYSNWKSEKKVTIKIPISIECINK